MRTYNGVYAKKASTLVFVLFSIPCVIERLSQPSSAMRIFRGAINSIAMASFLLLFTPALAWAAKPKPIPISFTATYSLFTKGLRFATMTRQLSRRSHGDYIFRSESRATGLAKLVLKGHVIEQSHWRLAEERIYSQSYSYLRTGIKPKSITARFDWSRGVILGSDGKETWRLDARPNMLDKLSYQLAIMLDLEAGKRFLEYEFVDEHAIKTYRFAVVSEEILETPIGKLRTVKLERTNEKQNRSTILWCAPEFRYLPVRLDKRKNESLESAVIESFSGLR